MSSSSILMQIKTQHAIKCNLVVPSSNLRVEAAACFLMSSSSKEINNGVGGFFVLNSFITEIMRSATYKIKERFCNLLEKTKRKRQSKPTH